MIYLIERLLLVHKFLSPLKEPYTAFNDKHRALADDAIILARQELRLLIRQKSRSCQ